MEFSHIPVLKDECIECLGVKSEGVYVDGTLGGGGHSLAILNILNSSGILIGIDRDMDAINTTSERLKSYSNFIPVHDNYQNIQNVLEKLNMSGVDGILLDLGVSSYQLDERDRGFSYMHDAKLDMRMNRQDKLTAYDVVNKYSEDKLREIFYEYGEESYSKSIARNIVKKREQKWVETTLELVSVIKGSLPGKVLNSGSHPAKKVFQAIRIEVNGELDRLKETVTNCVKVLNPKGRLCIITFHSLEDRIVKKAYEEMEGKCTCPKDLPKCVCNYVSYGKVLTKKPIVPTEQETKLNSRAKSSKLRVFERE